MKSIREQNTLNWLESYKYGNSLRDMPSLNLADSEKLRNRSVLMLAEFDGVNALVLSFKKKGNLLLVPVSEYAKPSSEFEVFLPKSNLVLQTWNARVVNKADLGEYFVEGEISEEDMLVAQSHYQATFNNAEFELPSLIGASLTEVDADVESEVLEYVNTEAELLPEDIFIVLDGELTLSAMEGFESESVEVEEEEDSNVFSMPIAGVYDMDLLKAASKKPKKD